MHLALALFSILVASEDQLILHAGSVYSYGRGRWSEVARGSQVVRVSDDMLAIGNDERWSLLRVDTRALMPLAALDTIDRGKDTIIPVYLGSDRALFASLIKFDRLVLYEVREDAKAKALETKQGAGEYEFNSEGSYLYVERPGMGSAESPHFGDTIPGHSTELFRVDRSGKKETLIEVPGLNGPRFVAESSIVLYWRPGRVDERSNRKSWILESLELETKRTRVLAEYQDVLYVGDATSNRFPPAWYSWEDSPWVVIPESGLHPKNVEMVNAQTRERHAFFVPDGWELVPRIEGPARGASLIVCKMLKKGEPAQVRTIRAVSVPMLESLVQAKLPAAIGRVSSAAFFRH